MVHWLRRSFFALSTFLVFTANAGAELPEHVRGFIGKYCVSCHGPEEQKGDFRIDTLGISRHTADAAYWQLVLDNLYLGDMPPVRHPVQPEFEEVEPITQWIESELSRARLAFQGQTGEVVLRRLNRAEYVNTIADLLDVHGVYADGFPEDALDHGFDNNGAALMLSAAQVDEYVAAANLILDRAIQPGERPETKRMEVSLHDINHRAWEGTKAQLERRERDFDSLTPQEQERTREMQERFRQNPDMGWAFPIYENGKLRAPTREDGPGKDAVITVRALVTNVPTTHRVLPVNRAGWYRFEVTGYALKNEGKPVRLRIYKSSFGRAPIEETIDVVHFISEEPMHREYLVYLEPEQHIRMEMIDGTNWARDEDKLELPGPFIAIRSAYIEGPIHEEWPPRGHRVLFGEYDPGDENPATVREIIAHFGPKLFRRPVDRATVERFGSLYDRFREQHAHPEALKQTLVAMMVAPQFLYRLEPPGQLDGYAMASRLSYFLWRSMPDEELMGAAASGALFDPPQLTVQIERMIADPRSERFVEDFAGQWLRVNEVGSMRPDMHLYPEYDEHLEAAIREETTRFIGEMFYNNLAIANLIDSDWAMLNERLAEHYGIDGVEGPEFRRVALDKAQTVRGGLLTQASFHAVTSDGTTTSPINRGVWILENFLGTPPPPPPPDVPAIEPDIRGATNILDQLAKHRDIPACASCHVRIDPLGIALENFDVIGGWRENYRALTEENGNRPRRIEGPPVVSASRLENVGDFNSFTEFRELLMQRQDLVKLNVAHKLATFALGRTLDFSDREDLQQIVRVTDEHGGGMRTMVHALIQSPLFTRP